MALTRTIRQWSVILSDPVAAFSSLKKRTFEETLSEYLILLICTSMLAGITYFLMSIGRAAYYQLALHADVQYWRLANYAFGGTTATLFFYFFAGTFLLFIASMLLAPLGKSIKYTRRLAVLFYALTPILMFGWVTALVPALIIWSTVLYITGIKLMREDKIKKGTLRDRQ